MSDENTITADVQYDPWRADITDNIHGVRFALTLHEDGTTTVDLDALEAFARANPVGRERDSSIPAALFTWSCMARVILAAAGRPLPAEAPL